MEKIKGVCKYIILKSLHNVYFLFVIVVAFIVLIIMSFSSRSIDFNGTYLYFNLYGFMVSLSLGKGIIANELSSKHAELIFTKPIRREAFISYMYIGCLGISFVAISFFMFISAIISVYFSSFNLFSFLKILFYICLNQITILALLFFLSSWMPGSLNSALLFLIVFSYPIFRIFIFPKHPYLGKIIDIIKEIITPFKVEPFMNQKVTVLKFIYHWLFYPISLLYGSLKIVKNKEIIIH